MKKYYTLSLFLLCNFLHAQSGTVGIGTTDPQQKLHLENSVGTLRAEGLDKNNNQFNGGNTNPTATYPLYVDSDGVLSLKLQTLYNSDGIDAIDHTNIAANSVTLLSSDVDGKNETTFETYTITVTRNSILEIKYSISFEVYMNSALAQFRDAGARRITTFYTLDNGTRRYGEASKCYMNNNLNNPAPYTSSQALAAPGVVHNSTTTYVQLTPGTHTLQFKAEVSTNLPSLATYVKLAVDTDSIFMRLY